MIIINNNNLSMRWGVVGLYNYSAPATTDIYKVICCWWLYICRVNIFFVFCRSCFMYTIFYCLFVSYFQKIYLALKRKKKFFPVSAGIGSQTLLSDVPRPLYLSMLCIHVCTHTIYTTYTQHVIYLCMYNK